MTRPPRPVADAAQLHRARPGDPYLRCELPPGAPVRGYVDDDLPGTVAVVRRQHGDGRLGATVLGDPQAASVLAASVLAAETVATLVLPRGADCPVEAERMDSWDWMAAWEPPPAQPGEDGVVEVDDADHDALTALLDRSGPLSSRRPGHPLLAGWVGIWDDGRRLVACAAYEWHRPGLGHLSSIATSPAHRGRGLGTAVTAALTRRLLDGGAEAVALGVYADNTVARRLYERLGFSVGWRFDTWLPASPAGPSSTPPAAC